jgi:hypothetical protein
MIQHVSTLTDAVADGAEPLVEREADIAIVALEILVVDVVELVRLPVVLVARVTRSRGEHRVDQIPHHQERRRPDVERESCAGEVVDVLDLNI